MSDHVEAALVAFVVSAAINWTALRIRFGDWRFWR